MERSRVCSRCGLNKTAEHFSENGPRLRSRCKECEAELRRAERDSKTGWRSRIRENDELEKSGQRRCYRCKIIKPISEFRSRSDHRAKIDTRCLECADAVAAQRRSKHRNENRLRQREYFQRNREAVNLRQRLSYSRNPEKRREQSRSYRNANIEKYREYDRKRSKTPERKKRAAETYQKFRRSEKWTATRDRWRHENRAVLKSYIHARRAKMSGQRFTKSDIDGLLERQRGRCASCRISIKKRWTVDHVMPVALGGTNDVSNLQLLCRSCNSRKGKTHPDDWARKVGRLFI